MMKDSPARANSDPVRLASGDEPDWMEAVHRFGFGLRHQGRDWRPPTDVYETDQEFVVVIEVAGMRGAEFAVSLSGRILRVRGRRQHRGGSAAYHQMEVNDGDFAVDVRFPVAVDRDRIEAVYNDGFLRVRLPKTEPRRIPIS